MAGESDQQPLHKRDGPMDLDRPPKKKACTGFCCYQCLVVLYSLLFLMMGICLFIMGVWIGKVKTNYDSINDALTAPVILAVVVGLFMLFFAFLGLVGAARETLILLKIFLGIAIIVFLGQVIIGILAFIYREEAINVVNKQMSFAIDRYEKDDDVSRGVDHIQQKFECCGLDGPGNWKDNEVYSCDSEHPQKSCGVPDSCCSTYYEGCGYGIRNEANITQFDATIFEKGCTTKFQAWLERNLDIVGATALGLCLLHVLGIFFTYFFITSVHDRVWLFQYRKRYYKN